ncbi:DNA polymerase III subunit beta [Heyndrickxia oleronia]|uniref:DNA polymerase III subunit beta n=1 Tax=Heyndrickxia oleronia TaxID=38875 RepID=UPI00204150F3|nr:DNA polymerase III subunit beta [Heyndrickxia oleronia]MCM3454790.1 DNA polymerase III subunit beta [Heyndrickxia oleronia]
MKISVQKSILLKSINHVMKAVATNTTLPILMGIKVIATNKGIELTGSDGNISTVSFIPAEFLGDTLAEITKEGGIILQAKYFSEIIKKLPKDDVEIEVKEYVATIKSGKSKFKINGLDVVEYPRLPRFDEDNVITLKANQLKQLISETTYAVSKSGTRPILTGVQWQVKSNVLICLATDSHRLAKRELPIKGLSDSIQVVIPGSSLDELNKILEDSDEKVDVVLTENQVIFQFTHVTFYSRLLEGNYPDTARLIPTSYKSEIIVNAKELQQALERVLVLVSNGDKNVVKMDIQINEIFIKLSGSADELGKMNEEIIAESITGEDIIISFSPKYMKEALKTLNGSISIQFTGSMRPFIIKKKGNDELIHMLLPVRTY